MSLNKIAVISDSMDYDKKHILQLISKARSLADSTNGNVLLCTVGIYNTEKIHNLSRYGLDSLIIYEQDKKSNIWEYADIVSDMMTRNDPELIILPATDYGKDIAAVISTRFEAGLTADCIDISLNVIKEISFFRAALNDSVIAEICCKDSNLKLCTIKEDVFTVEKKWTDKICSINRFSSDNFTTSRDYTTKLLDQMQCEKEDFVDISKYETVFCVGRGVSSLTTLRKIESLASRYKGVVIGSRAAVEKGFIRKEYQVGQSGKSISPKVYIGFGISGASQHVVGIINADLIIAVNNDPSAAIFQYADYSIVADIDEFLDELQ